MAHGQHCDGSPVLVKVIEQDIAGDAEPDFSEIHHAGMQCRGNFYARVDLLFYR